MSIIQFGNEVVVGNPVDTGFSRAGWRIGTVNDGFQPPPVQRLRAKKGEPPPAPQLEPAEFNFADIPDIGEDCIIFNNADYISYLEGLDGVEPVSDQAPNGWINEAVERWPEIVKGNEALYD